MGYWADNKVRSGKVKLGEDAQAILRAYNWPGNVRELENAIEQALVFCEGDVIQPQDLPAFLQKVSGKPPPNSLAVPEGPIDLNRVLEDLEQALTQLRSTLKAQS